MLLHPAERLDTMNDLQVDQWDLVQDSGHGVHGFDALNDCCVQRPCPDPWQDLENRAPVSTCYPKFYLVITLHGTK